MRGGRGRVSIGGTVPKWIYKTDEAGRPRRFLSHREAAWWAARKVSVVFVPLLVYPFVWALFGFGSPYPWSAVLFVATGVILASPTTVGAVYLYLVLSGGVMGEADRRRHRKGGADPAAGGSSPRDE